MTKLINQIDYRGLTTLLVHELLAKLLSQKSRYVGPWAHAAFVNERNVSISPTFILYCKEVFLIYTKSDVVES